MKSGVRLINTLMPEELWQIIERKDPEHFNRMEWLYWSNTRVIYHPKGVEAITRDL